MESVVFKGVHYEMILDVSGERWMVQSTVAKEPGDVVGIYVEPDNFHVMKGEGEFKRFSLIYIPWAILFIVLPLFARSLYQL